MHVPIVLVQQSEMDPSKMMPASPKLLRTCPESWSRNQESIPLRWQHRPTDDYAHAWNACLAIEGRIRRGGTGISASATDIPALLVPQQEIYSSEMSTIFQRPLRTY